MFDRNDMGRFAYGLAAVWLGVIGLIAQDFAGVWQPLDNIGLGANRPVIASIYALLFLAAGVAAWLKRSATAGLAVLAVLHLLAMLGWISRIAYGGWTGFFEMLSLVIAGLVALARLQSPSPGWHRVIAAGQGIFAICLLAFGLSHLMMSKETAGMVPGWIPPNPLFWAYATGVCYLLAGIAILTRVRDKLAAQLTVVMMLSFNVFVWLPMLMDKPNAFNWAGNAITFAMASAAWVIADSLTRPDTARSTTRMLADPG